MSQKINPKQVLYRELPEQPIPFYYFFLTLQSVAVVAILLLATDDLMTAGLIYVPTMYLAYKYFAPKRSQVYSLFLYSLWIKIRRAVIKWVYKKRS